MIVHASPSSIGFSDGSRQLHDCGEIRCLFIGRPHSLCRCSVWSTSGTSNYLVPSHSTLQLRARN